MNQLLSSDKINIAVVGRQNAGKSSLVNALLGEEQCTTSHLPGTPINSKRNLVELLTFGPVVLVDTAGIDKQNTAADSQSTTIKALSSADFVIVVLNAPDILNDEEKQLFSYLEKISLPFIIAVNKIELGINPVLLEQIKKLGALHFEISCRENAGIERLKSKLIRMLPDQKAPSFLSDIINQGDMIVMVAPENPEIQEGYLITPVREALDEETVVIVTKEKQLQAALAALKRPPDMVVSAATIITRVAKIVPESVKLTTYSILMARYNSDLPLFINSLPKIEHLQDGDKVLIAEACTSHPPEDDTGKSKIPGMLQGYINKKINIEYSASKDLPEDLSKYRLIVNCNGCKLSRKAMCTRTREALLFDVPVINYGMLISYIQGNVPRVINPFIEASTAWEKLNLSVHHN